MLLHTGTGYCRRLFAAFLFCLTCHGVAAQQDSLWRQAIRVPAKQVARTSRQVAHLQQHIQHFTNRDLKSIRRREAKRLSRLGRRDPVLAKELTGRLQEEFPLLDGGSVLTGLPTVYVGRIDSLLTATAFLDQSGLQNAFLEKFSSQLGDLQHALNRTELISSNLQGRQQLLRHHLNSLGASRPMKQLNKRVFYYKARVLQVQELAKQPHSWERHVLNSLQQQSRFQQFFARHSQLGQLFNLTAGNEAIGEDRVSANGLQTRSSLKQVMRERFGEENMEPVLRSQVQAVRVQPDAKSMVPNPTGAAPVLGTMQIGNTQAAVGQKSFRPNMQRSRTFWQRIELGTNLQVQRARHFFPATANIGLTAGYRLNNRNSIGIGVAYRLGLGESWDRVALSHQGLGLRSFWDWQLKGSLYLTGGYEQNYLTAFRSLTVLKDRGPWQRSGLAGLTQTFTLGKRKGNMQLLWDFMANQQVPRGQSFIWRVGTRF